MCKRLLFAMLLVGIYAISVLPLIFWERPTCGFATLLALALYALLALQFSADFVEILLALLWSPHPIPCLDYVNHRAETAILITICDDWNDQCEESLFQLSLANLDVYVLDDSETPTVLPQALVTRVHHLCRPSRVGAKAGNLNNWLWNYGQKYKYALVLDSDSVISVQTVNSLLSAAEHPLNAHIAIFQSKTLPVPTASLMAHIVGIGARPRMRVLERVHANLGLLLSFGHNQLIRLDPLRWIGGFDESLTCEDTVLTLRLASAGWEVALLNTWSYDSDPDTIAAYIRRTTRWARQTVEICRMPWRHAPLRLKLTLCRHLLSYLNPLFGITLLSISIFTAPNSATEVWAFLREALTFSTGYVLYGVSIWSSSTLFVIYLLLRGVLARLEGISWGSQLLAGIFGCVPQTVMLFPLAVSIFASSIGRRVAFIPTNSRSALSRDIRPTAQLIQLAGTAIPVSGLVAAALKRPGSLLVGFNAVWLLALIAPLIGLLIIRCAAVVTAAVRPQTTVERASEGPQ